MKFSTPVFALITASVVYANSSESLISQRKERLL